MPETSLGPQAWEMFEKREAVQFSLANRTETTTTKRANQTLSRARSISQPSTQRHDLAELVRMVENQGFEFFITSTHHGYEQGDDDIVSHLQ